MPLPPLPPLPPLSPLSPLSPLMPLIAPVPPCPDCCCLGAVRILFWPFAVARLWSRTQPATQKVQDALVARLLEENAMKLLGGGANAARVPALLRLLADGRFEGLPQRGVVSMVD